VSDDNLLGLILTAGVLISAPFAIRATWRLWRLWRQDHEHSLLLLAFWVVALIVTVAGLWVGFLQVRRLIGYEPLDWSPPITAILTIIVLQIPMILDSLTQRVQTRPDQPDNIGGGEQ
jgi:flagellar biosynthesis protein FliQ